MLQMLKPTSFSPILAAVGVILIMSGKEESKKKDIGNILIGFAILMFGMEAMSSAVSGLSDNSQFTGVLTTFSKNPILGMLAGAIFTAVIQSSSASVGILQALCSTGVISFGVAIPIIMGQNIGTCITSILSAIGANRNAKRAAMIHLYFNVIGTACFMVVFYGLHQFVDFVFLSDMTGAADIAVIHSLFNIGSTILLLPFSDQLVKLAQITIPEKKEKEALAVPDRQILVTLDERFLDRPAFAMEICRNKIRDMAKDTKQSILLAMEVLNGYDKKKAKQVEELEQRVDAYEDVLGSYLVKLSAKNISKKDSQSLSVMLHTINEFERISDHAVNLVEAAREIKKKDLWFSKKATYEIEVLCEAVEEIVTETTEVFCQENVEGAVHIEPLEEVIDSLTKKMKKHHVKRLQNGKCTIEMGLILEDVLTDLERVSDHCSNIAVEMMTIDEDGFDTHKYFNDMSEKDMESFREEYEKWKMKYQLKKK